MPPPAKSPSRLIGGVGFSGAAEHGECAGHCDVVDVVTSGLGERAGLAVTGHAPVDHPRVSCADNVWADAEPLTHTWAEGINTYVSLVECLEQSGDVV